MAVLADAYAYVQRLVSVVKMATMLEELRSVVRLWQKDFMQIILMKKCFMFIVGNVCHVKRFRTWTINSLKDIRKS
jgi:hypothetical protein